MSNVQRFAKTLSSISRRISKLQSTEICCGGLTREQFDTLRTIQAERAPSIGSLSAALRVDLSTMSRNISVLERERYVSRSRATQDARFVTVVLTPKGRDALEILRCDEQDVMTKVFGRLPGARRTSIMEALETVEAALQPDDASGGDACCPPSGSQRAAR
jgi:DNA-binding MarR family transcriptional regulator